MLLQKIGNNNNIDIDYYEQPYAINFIYEQISINFSSFPPSPSYTSPITWSNSNFTLFLYILMLQNFDYPSILHSLNLTQLILVSFYDVVCWLLFSSPSNLVLFWKRHHFCISSSSTHLTFLRAIGVICHFRFGFDSCHL